MTTAIKPGTTGPLPGDEHHAASLPAPGRARPRSRRAPRVPGGRDRRVGVGVGSVALLTGSAVSLAGGSPALLVITVLALGSWLLAGRLSTVLGVTAAISLLLAGHTILSRTTPLLGWDHGASGIAALVLTGLVLLVLLVRTPAARLARLGRAGLATGACALALPLVSGVGVFGALLLGNPGYTWAMKSDMIWNTVAGRFILGDGGISSAHPNPSPLMNALVATWIAPGRSAAPELLRHDVARQAELWILLTLLAAALAGLIVARAVPPQRRLLRLGAGVLGSAIPLSWYATGSMLEFGFLNVMAAMVLLFASWLTWKELPARPVAASAVLLLCTALLLAAWAPLAVLPLGLAGAGVLARVPVFTALRGSTALLWWLAVLQLPVYLVGVTLPDLSRDGGALAADGAVPAITATSVLTSAALLFAVAVFAAVGLGLRHDLAGVVVVLAMGGIGVGYLLAQRWGVAALWGYYPVKLAWLLGILFLVLLAALVVPWLGHAGARGVLGGAVVVACLLLTVLGLRALPLPAGPASSLPLAGVAGVELRGADTVRSDTLFRIADDGHKTIVSRLGQQPGADSFVNGWLLQLQAGSSADPIRAHSYWLNPDDPAMLCAAMATWGAGVVVETADPGLEGELRGLCPELAYSVRMTQQAPAAAAG